MDFSVKVDFQGFNQCLQQNKLENEDNIQIVDYKPSSGYAILESFLVNTESNPIVISFKSDSSGSNKPNVINVDNRTYKPCKKATSGYA